ncbi:MAG: DUF359 domain-containing protein [Thermoplasmata archaeon HGW-Thermoplasmata-2]|nr:MAG: DUF359 domain-containing protein [Thermoplasmata archaeon HGW-Thermoplasmata-2]
MSRVLYQMPNGMRSLLAEPLGPVIQDADLAEHLRGARVIISVGDVVTATLYKHGFAPDVAIVDYKTKRNVAVDSKKWREGKRVVRAANPQSEITEALWNAISEAYARLPEKTLIEVEGEEDLASLACIALAPSAPATYIIIYGMPDKGMAVVNSGEKEKKRVAEVLAAMKV